MARKTVGEEICQLADALSCSPETVSEAMTDCLMVCSPKKGARRDLSGESGSPRMQLSNVTALSKSVPFDGVKHRTAGMPDAEANPASQLSIIASSLPSLHIVSDVVTQCAGWNMRLVTLSNGKEYSLKAHATIAHLLFGEYKVMALDRGLTVNEAAMVAGMKMRMERGNV